MAESKKQTMIVTISDQRPIHDVAQDLKKAGFDVEQIMEAINVITGSTDADSKARLKGINGVVDVSEDHPVDIGPPGQLVS